MSKCRLFHPRPRSASLGCERCGESLSEHSLIVGKPDNPFEPLPEIPNSSYAPKNPQDFT
jgi:hypothetical protein